MLFQRSSQLVENTNGKVLVLFFVAVFIVLVAIGNVLSGVNLLVQTRQLATFQSIETEIRGFIEATQTAGLKYEDLPNGTYTVMLVPNRHAGIALMRQSLPTGDRDLVVANVPQSGLKPGEIHNILR